LGSEASSPARNNALRFTDQQGDALDIPSFFADPGLPGTPGHSRDRSIPDPAKPWRTADSDDGVDLTHALNNLMSFGHECSGPPQGASRPQSHH
jgi:hypothetical protein